MTTTRVYRSSDSGAPTVQYNSPGSLLAVLRACLVDGYGSKSPAGWSEPYTGTNIAVFQNSAAAGGTGCCVRVDDTDATTNSFTPIPFQTYASMSDIDTGVASTGLRYMYRRPSSQNFHPEWIVWTDELTFYINIWAPGASNPYRCAAGAGDIISFQPGDAFRYGAFGNASTSWQSAAWFCDIFGGKGGFNTAVPSGDTGVRLGADHTGIGGAVQYANLFSGQSNRALGCLDYPPVPTLNAADELAMPYILVRQNVVRGRMRGLYLPLSNRAALDCGDPGPSDLVALGSTVEAMKGGMFQLASPTNGTMWVETSLPWG